MIYTEPTLCMVCTQLKESPAYTVHYGGEDGLEYCIRHEKYPEDVKSKAVERQLLGVAS